jgi:hypothetical protein
MVDSDAVISVGRKRPHRLEALRPRLKQVLEKVKELQAISLQHELNDKNMESLSKYRTEADDIKHVINDATAEMRRRVMGMCEDDDDVHPAGDL